MEGSVTHPAGWFLHGQTHMLHSQHYTDHVWPTGDAQLAVATKLASHEGGILVNDAAAGT